MIVLLLLTGCSLNKSKEDDNNINLEPDIIEDTNDVYEDDNPIKVGLYNNGKLVTEYRTKFVNGRDIGSFDIYFTDIQDVGSTNTKYNFKKYYNNYNDIDNYKIGFYISFEANNEHYEKVVLDYDVEFALQPYIYIYLYDDVHQPDGAFYNHVTKEDYGDDTIFSSIKLYLARRKDEIQSDITLSVFTYDSDDDFDDEGYYRGNSIYTMTIKKLLILSRG